MTTSSYWCLPAIINHVLIGRVNINTSGTANVGLPQIGQGMYDGAV